MVAAQAALTSVIFLLAIRRGEGGVSPVELAMIALAGAGVIGWIVVDEPLVATVCVVAADLIGAAMMVPKTYRDPESETLVTFAFASVAGAFAAGAVGALDVSLLLYPIYFCLANGAIALLIVQRRRVPWHERDLVQHGLPVHVPQGRGPHRRVPGRHPGRRPARGRRGRRRRRQRHPVLLRRRGRAPLRSTPSRSTRSPPPRCGRASRSTPRSRSASPSSRATPPSSTLPRARRRGRRRDHRDGPAGRAAGAGAQRAAPPRGHHRADPADPGRPTRPRSSSSPPTIATTGSRSPRPSTNGPSTPVTAGTRRRSRRSSDVITVMRVDFAAGYDRRGRGRGAGARRSIPTPGSTPCGSRAGSAWRHGSGPRADPRRQR